ncbi:MAG: DUF222 domain-containing protein, partial [Propionibacteriaceae bacterium]
MSELQDHEAIAPSAADAMVARLDQILDDFASAVADTSTVSDAVRIDRITRLEKLRAATAALQVAESVRFAQSQVAEQLAADVHPEQIGRGIAEQIGLACRIAPASAARRLNIARALWCELPNTYSQLVAGDMHEKIAETVVSETQHLDAEIRGAVDQQLKTAGITRMGVKAATAAICKTAYEADRDGYVQRGRTERKHRRVGMRPAPDTMAVLSGYLPVEQGVACYAALRKHADTAKASGDGRTRDQIMADTLVERLTGQTTAADVNLELQIMMPLQTLLDPNSATPAMIPGYGPLPTDLARDILITSQGRKWWRRLFTAPSASKTYSGPIVGGDPHKRCFDGWLASLIRLRDQETCRNPFCGAPIRHLDHITRHTDGGATSYSNGRGTCERCNYTREMPGWQISVIDAEHLDKPHTMIITTPTGHHYLSRAPDP